MKFQLLMLGILLNVLSGQEDGSIKVLLFITSVIVIYLSFYVE